MRAAAQWPIDHGKLNELEPPHRGLAWAARAAALIHPDPDGHILARHHDRARLLAGIMVLGAGAALVVRGVRPAPPATDIAARKSFVQRLGAAAVLSLSSVAGRYVRRDNGRYLAFGSLVDGAFLTNSKRRWPTG